MRCQYTVADSLVHEKGRCVTYGFSENNIHYNVYNGQPQELTNSEAIAVLEVRVGDRASWFVCLLVTYPLVLFPRETDKYTMNLS